MRWEIAMAIAFLSMLGGAGVLFVQLQTLPPAHSIQPDSLAVSLLKPSATPPARRTIALRSQSTAGSAPSVEPTCVASDMTCRPDADSICAEPEIDWNVALEQPLPGEPIATHGAFPQYPRRVARILQVLPQIPLDATEPQIIELLALPAETGGLDFVKPSSGVDYRWRLARGYTMSMNVYSMNAHGDRPPEYWSVGVRGPNGEVLMTRTKRDNVIR